jgi:hypothetical protein
MYSLERSTLEKKKVTLPEDKTSEREEKEVQS